MQFIKTLDQILNDGHAILSNAEENFGVMKTRIHNKVTIWKQVSKNKFNRVETYNEAVLGK